jgi:hypothetical protein
LGALGGSVVYEVGYGVAEAYELTLLGVLLSDRGGRAESLLVRYLEYVQGEFDRDPEIIQIKSEDVQNSLGLTTDEAMELHELVWLSQLWGGSASGGSGQPWTVGLPHNVEELPPDLSSYVKDLAIRHYDPNCPLEQGRRESYVASLTRGLGVESVEFVDDRNWGENPQLRFANVFISHAAADAAIAMVLKSEILRHLPDVRVFSSSDPTDLPPGSRWSERIQRGLLTPNSSSWWLPTEG